MAIGALAEKSTPAITGAPKNGIFTLLSLKVYHVFIHPLRTYSNTNCCTRIKRSINKYHLADSRRSFRTRGGTSSVRQYVVEGRSPESFKKPSTERTKLVAPPQYVSVSPCSVLDSLLALKLSIGATAVAVDSDACSGCTSSSASEPLEGVCF